MMGSYETSKNSGEVLNAAKRSDITVLSWIKQERRVAKIVTQKD